MAFDTKKSNFFKKKKEKVAKSGNKIINSFLKKTIKPKTKTLKEVKKVKTDSPKLKSSELQKEKRSVRFLF